MGRSELWEHRVTSQDVSELSRDKFDHIAIYSRVFLAFDLGEVIRGKLSIDAFYKNSEEGDSGSGFR